MSVYAGDRKSISARGMNKCADCGKMARWEDLEWQESYDMDMGGNVTQTDWFEHKTGMGCKQEVSIRGNAQEMGRGHDSG
jgi:hypothetical protein